MLSEYRNYPAATEMQSDLAGNYLTRAPSGVADPHWEFAAVNYQTARRSRNETTRSVTGEVQRKTFRCFSTSMVAICCIRRSNSDVELD